MRRARHLRSNGYFQLPGEMLLNDSASAVGAARAAGQTAVGILAAISFCHMLNDMMQSLLPAMYPMLKGAYRLSFGQIGLLTFTFQFTASLLQPLIGAYADRRPRPYSLAVGMGFTLAGLLLLAYAGSYALLLCGAALIGTGSSVFHPESSRVARMASGGRHGLAQSVFQVGGNFGSAAGPLLAAFIVLPHGQTSVAWFSGVALLGMVVLFNVGHWYKRHGVMRLKRAAAAASGHTAPARDHRHRGAPGADLLQVLLPGEHHQLLHLLPHRSLPRLGAQRAAAAVRLSRLRRARRLHWRPTGGSAGREIHHLGLDPRCAALHAAAAARQSLVDRGC